MPAGLEPVGDRSGLPCGDRFVTLPIDDLPDGASLADQVVTATEAAGDLADRVEDEHVELVGCGGHAFLAKQISVNLIAPADCINETPLTHMLMLLGATNKPEHEPVESDARPTKRPRHPNSLANLKRTAGPGRTPGSRNKFSAEAVQRFVAQYRNDLAADWDKHGEAFIAKCRDLYPQIYATMQRMRIEDELSRVQTDAGPITISWAASDRPPPPAPREPPKQLTFKPREMPADLSPADWSVLMQLMDLLKRTLPSNSETVPAEIFDLIRKALLEHFREQ
jgi:hypothetical protein